MKKKVWTKESVLAMVAKNVLINEETGCHEWQGPRSRDGYGQLGSRGAFEMYGIKGVHRLVVHLVHGHEFAGRHEQVMHSCHNRSCCNPDHLSVGTAKENMAAAVARGSMVGAMLRGEAHPHAIHTEEEVRTIKMMIADGWRNLTIAMELGLDRVAFVSEVRTGRRWAHVTI